MRRIRKFPNSSISGVNNGCDGEADAGGIDMNRTGRTYSGGRSMVVCWRSSSELIQRICLCAIDAWGRILCWSLKLICHNDSLY